MPFESRNIVVFRHIDSSVLIGQNLVLSTLINPVTGDATPINNADSLEIFTNELGIILIQKK